MAMPQRDDYIDELNKTDALLQFALMHDDREEVERLRAKLLRLSGLGDRLENRSNLFSHGDCQPVWNGKN